MHQSGAIIAPPTLAAEVVPRVCIVDGRRHMRNFIEEAPEEPGFTTRGWARVGGLSAMFE
jgi:hypothetical protein